MTGRVRVAVVAACVCSLVVLLGGMGAAAPRVFAYYYPWYANPTVDGAWFHWTQNGHSPPDDIGANYYPTLGAYSSNDPAVLAQHMDWALEANVEALVTSWWGRTSFSGQAAPGVLNAASSRGLKVCFHLEPYGGRTASKVKSDIQYLYSNYGTHPGFLKVSRPTKWGPSSAQRGVFFVFAPGDIPDADWRAMLDSIRGTADDAIVLASGGPALIDRCHFDGVYLYANQVGSDGSNLAGLKAQVVALNSIFCGGVGPGFVNTRAGGDIYKPRTPTQYDTMWAYAVQANPEWIGITSFNEWHEGTQIEPAVPKSITGYTYLDYEGDYGLYGELAETAYLWRTAAWVNLFLNPPEDGAAVISSTIPDTVVRNCPQAVQITMRNTGTSTWTQAAGYALSSVNPDDNTTWGLNRVDLGASDSIGPGQQKTFSFDLTGPDSVGLDFACDWQMIREGTGRFGAISAQMVDVHTFADVPPSKSYWRHVEGLYTAGVTNGCGTDAQGRPLFCPDRTTTRKEAAVFIVRGAGKTPLDNPTPTFTDVTPDKPYYGHVERLADDASWYDVGNPCLTRPTQGCGPSLYCPDRDLTRAMVAVFLCRACGKCTWDNPTPTFTDVPPTASYYGYVERLADPASWDGDPPTRGCAPDLFCPDDSATRAMMAVFLVRAFKIPY